MQIYKMLVSAPITCINISPSQEKILYETLVKTVLGVPNCLTTMLVEPQAM